MNQDLNIEIISDSSDENPFLVIYKPRGLPSAPLFEGDDSALTQAVQIHPEIKEILGRKKIEYGLIHRIDTETEGLVLIATNQESYDSILSSQDSNQFEKYYHAICEINFQEDLNLINGFAPRENNLQDILFEKNILTLKSKLRYFSKNRSEVRPVTEKSNLAAKKKCIDKIFETKIEILNIDRIHSTVEIKANIKKGFKHQVRCHLAWQGLPILGDKIYNSNPQCDFMFKAYSIKFPHPITKKDVLFSIDI